MKLHIYGLVPSNGPDMHLVDQCVDVWRQAVAVWRGQAHGQQLQIARIPTRTETEPLIGFELVGVVLEDATVLEGMLMRRLEQRGNCRVTLEAPVRDGLRLALSDAANDTSADICDDIDPGAPVFIDVEFGFPLDDEQRRRISRSCTLLDEVLDGGLPVRAGSRCGSIAGGFSLSFMTQSWFRASWEGVMVDESLGGIFQRWLLYDAPGMRPVSMVLWQE